MKLHIGGRDFIQYFMLFHNFKKLEMKMLASKSHGPKFKSRLSLTNGVNLGQQLNLSKLQFLLL